MSDKNLSQFFLSYLYFLALLWKQLWIKNVFISFTIYWNTLMTILCLKVLKRLLSQNQRVRINFLGYRQYEHWLNISKLFKKNIKVIGRHCPTNNFNKSSTSECKFSDLSLLALKFINFPCYFLNKEPFQLETLHHSSVSWDITLSSKCKFSDFWMLAWKLTKFLMSFFKQRISFPLNFTSTVSVMTHDSYEIF